MVMLDSDLAAATVTGTGSARKVTPTSTDAARLYAFNDSGELVDAGVTGKVWNMSAQVAKDKLLQCKPIYGLLFVDVEAC